MSKIDLNSLDYYEVITMEDILKHVTQEQIFSYYIGEDVNKLGLYHSPLRKDNIPSFALFFHKDKKDILIFYDLATKDSGDFIVLVCKMFNIDYATATRKIIFDLGLSKNNIEAVKKNIVYTRLIRKEPIKLGVKTRKWLIKDKNYWSQFGIKKSTLIKFNVHPLSHIFYNDNAVQAAYLSYVYVEQKDDKVSYKIYQPLEDKMKKWINNANYSVHQGYSLLPKKGDLLIITKSLKDVMSIHDCLNTAAIGLQSETVMMKESVMQEYKTRFTKILCLFDNDEAGKKLAKSFAETYNIPTIFVPEYKNQKVKDFSDLVKFKGILSAVKIVNKIINNI